MLLTQKGITPPKEWEVKDKKESKKKQQNKK